MANFDKNDIEQFGKAFEDMLNRIHYATRQDRNGSDLSADGVNHAIDEEKSKHYKELSDKINQFKSDIEESVKKLKEINASRGRTYETKKENYIKKLVGEYKKEQKKAALGAGMDKQSATNFAEERAKEYEEKLTKDINKISEAFKKYPEVLKKSIDESKKTLTQIEKEIKSQKLKEQLNVLSFGFSGRANQKIDKLATYGNALDGLGGRLADKGKAMSRLASMKGAAGGGTAVKAMGGLASGLGKLGGVVKMVGGLFTKLAGPIGWVISALQLFGDAINAINEYEIKQLGYDKEHYQAWLDFTKQFLDLENQAKTEQINYRYEVIQRNFDVESEIAKAAYSLSVDNYAKAVEISLGSITQGISQTAFSAASAAIEAGATAMTNVNTAAVEREKATASNEARSLKNEKTLENITQDLVSANIGYENTVSEIAQKRQHLKDRQYIVSNAQGVSRGALTGGSEIMMAGSDTDGVTASEGRYNSQETNAVGNTNRYSTEYTRNYETPQSVGSALGNATMNAIKSSTGGLESTQELAEKNLEYTNTLRAGSQDLQNIQIKNANNLAILQTEHETNLYNKKRDYDKSIYDKGMDGAKKVAQEYLKLTQKEFDVFGTLDETMRKSAIGVGILNENGIERYVENMTHRMPDIMRKWGVTFEEIANIQNAYTEATGRSINLSNADIEKSLGLTILTGDQGTTDELNADMQKFGMSVADSSDMFGEILDNARKLGLSTRKTGKDLVRDMKLANKYEFKGAKKALAEMSIWANKVRFDMSELPSLIDKQTGSFENVISNAASIQVLGGNFTSYMGDPLKNAFLGFQDPAELAKNVNSALKGIGFFNSSTGKTEISTTDQIRMKAFSEATGISMENLRNQVFQMVQGDKVMNALTPENSKTYTKKQKELLQQQAHFSNGEWKVTLANGDEKSINNLTKSDFADLMPHEEAMYDLTKEGVGYTKQGVDYLHELVGKAKKASGETNSQQIELFQQHTQEFYKTYDDMVKTARKYFDDHKSKFQEELDNNLRIVRESYQGYLKVAAEGKKEIDAKVKQIQGSASAIANTLVAVSQLFAEAESRVKTELNNGKQKNVRAEADKRGKEVINNAEAQRQTTERPQTTNRTQTQLQAYTAPSQGYANMGRAMSASITPTGTTDPIEETKKYISDYDKGKDILSTVLVQYLKKIDPSYNKYGFFESDTEIINDARKILKAKGITDIDDGVIAQNGNVIKIDNQDQILAAKEGGPVDKMLDTAQTAYSELPRENPYADNSNNGGKIEVAPIEIQLNGNIQLSGGNGTVDITSQIINDPIVMREITQIISKNIEMQINGGRVSNAFT